MYGATSIVSSDGVCGILDDYGTDIRLTERSSGLRYAPPLNVSVWRRDEVGFISELEC